MKRYILLIALLVIMSFVLSGCVNEKEDIQALEISTPLHTEKVKKRIIYLTFDDGPSEYTSELLEILDENSIKATFFVTADHEAYIPMIKEEAERGHRVGVHSYLHKNVLKKVYDSYEIGFNKMLEIINEQTGSKTDIFRFPGGSSNSLAPEKMDELIKNFTDLGFKYYDWDVDSLDSKDNATKEIVLESMKQGVLNSKEYSMILCHDVFKHTVEAIDEFVPWAKNNNFEFRIIDDNTPEVHHKILTEDTKNVTSS